MLLPGATAIRHGRWPGRRSPRPAGALLFRELQTFGWPWPGMLVALMAALVFGSVAIPFGSGMWQQLVLGRPWGDRPIPDAMLYVVGPLTILLSLLPFAMLFSRLSVEVRADGLLVELLRFKRPDVVLPDEVRAASLTTIGWFGWGVSSSPRRRVYRMAGSEGVEIELLSGKKIVIASERARTLLEAVLSMKGEPGERRR
jgi:hypothetical protein